MGAGSSQTEISRDLAAAGVLLSSGTHCRTADAYSQNSVESRPFVFGSRFLSVQVNPSLQFRERLSSACLLS